MVDGQELVTLEREKAPLPAISKETAATAVAVAARADVEARYAIAQRFPRVWMDVRNRMLQHCSRARFATTARYSKPVGGQKIMGWSVRFAEAAAREMGNLFISTTVVWDDEEKRIVRVTVTDLESNTSYPTDVVISKTIERYSSNGYEVLGSREKNGKTLYIVKANDDDILNKQGALVSKARRNNILALMPGDLLDECFDEVQEAASKEDAADPQAAAKKISKAFYEYGVSAKDLAAYLGKADFTGVTPEQVGMLRTIYIAIKDGELTWEAIVAAKAEGSSTTAKTSPEKGAEGLRKAVGAKPAPAPAPKREPGDEDLEEDKRIAAQDKGK